MHHLEQILLTGFPTETDEMFLDTKKVIKDLKFLTYMFFLTQKKMELLHQKCRKYL